MTNEEKYVNEKYFTQIYFDGYCPESMLKGKNVEMKLNEDDFWESLETGLQMTVFPPYAAILGWRGKGNFRESSDFASKTLKGLLLTETQRDEGKEIYPDERKLLNDGFDLGEYLEGIYENKEKFDAAKFNPDDPIFEEQKKYLATLKKSDFEGLFKYYELFKREGGVSNMVDDKFWNANFEKFHQAIYDLKLIFPFKWMSWYEGEKNLYNNDFDYSGCTLLELSMYITCIFRSDRFNPGTIEGAYKDGILDKIIGAIKVCIFDS